MFLQPCGEPFDVSFRPRPVGDHTEVGPGEGKAVVIEAAQQPPRMKIMRDEHLPDESDTLPVERGLDDHCCRVDVEARG